MRRTYLVTLKPLESYSFGGDRQFKFEGRQEEQNFSPYFIKTNAFPEQATIFGALRYHILNQEGLVKPDFNYSLDEREKMAVLIGKESLSLSANDQYFGKLKSMSPVFILKSNGDRIISNPFNNKLDEQEGEFSPMILDKKVETNFGRLLLPADDDFDAKQGYSSGYYNIDNACVEDNIFSEDVTIGISLEAEEDGLYKRQVYQMNKDYQFAVYVDYDGELKDGIVRLGQKGSLFNLQVAEADNSLELAVQSHLAKRTPKGMSFSYALSDMIVNQAIDFKQFAIIEEKHVRQLKTDWSEKGNLRAVRRMQDKILMYKRGSIFYDFIEIKECSAQLAGYNKIILVEGEK